MLNIKDYKGEFKMNTLIPIDEKRIFYESLLAKKEKFIGARGTIDNSYYFSIIKLGKIRQNQNMNNLIRISLENIPERNSWFNYDIVSPKPLSIIQNFIPFFNIVLLPLSLINSVDIYIKEQMISYEMIRSNILEYKINSSYASLSFNGLDKNDFKYSSFYDSESSIIFIKDVYNNFYIMSLSPIIELKTDGSYRFKSPYKSLKEILQE